MRCIYIMPVKIKPGLWLEYLISGITNAFGIDVEIIEHNIDIEKTYDPFRRQYNSSGILLDILNCRPAGTYKIIGIVNVDLFIPILTFVFGEAQLDGIGAIVSMHRLNNKFYALPEDPDLLSRRLVKEAIHELGHTFGLLHCQYPGCVMNSSTYIENIDQKSAEFCTQCQTDVSNYMKSSSCDKESSI